MRAAFHRDRHARAKIDDVVARPLVDRYSGGVDEIVLPLLAIFRRALSMGPGLGDVSAVARWCRARRSAPCHRAPIAGVVEGMDLDLGVLFGVNEAGVVVRQRGFDLEMAILRDHDCEHLGRRDDAAYRMHGKLLDAAVDGDDEILELRSPVGFDLIPGDACGLLFGFRQLVVQRAPELCRGSCRVSP